MLILQPKATVACGERFQARCPIHNGACSADYQARLEAQFGVSTRQAPRKRRGRLDGFQDDTLSETDEAVCGNEHRQLQVRRAGEQLERGSEESLEVPNLGMRHGSGGVYPFSATRRRASLNWFASAVNAGHLPASCRRAV